jgi:hypothetical protein
MAIVIAIEEHGGFALEPPQEQSGTSKTNTQTAHCQRCFAMHNRQKSLELGGFH